MPRIASQLDSVAIIRTVRAWATAPSLAQSWVQMGRNPISGLARIAPHIGSVVSMELSPSSRERTMPPFVSLNASSGPGEGYFSPEYAPFYISPNGGGLPDTTHPDGSAALDRRWAMLYDIDGELRSQAWLGGNSDDVTKFNIAARKLMYNGDVTKIFNFDQTV